MAKCALLVLCLAVTIPACSKVRDQLEGVTAARSPAHDPECGGPEPVAYFVSKADIDARPHTYEGIQRRLLDRGCDKDYRARGARFCCPY